MIILSFLFVDLHDHDDDDHDYHNNKTSNKLNTYIHTPANNQSTTSQTGQLTITDILPKIKQESNQLII
jgi:hypothetical protein